MKRLSSSLICLLLLSATPPVAVEPSRLAKVARSADVVVLLADARTGRPLGGIRTAEADQARYHPGSLFKLAIALAALRSGERAAAERHECTGRATINDLRQECWDSRGHGTLGLSDALAQSCNLYFRQIATGLSRDAILQAGRDLGMGDMFNGPIELNDTTLLGEAFTVSPANMLTTALALASRGRLAPRSIDLSNGRYRPLFAGLRSCVSAGTARQAWSRRFTLAGKTGTSFVPQAPGRRIGWFIGFAPADRPRVAIVVLHRQGIGADAAAVAGQVLAEVL